MPSIKIRNSTQINQALKKKAIIGNYVQIPVFDYLDNNIMNDLLLTGCQFVMDADSFYWYSNNTF